MANKHAKGIRTYLDISTSHITPGDYRLLQNGEFPLGAYEVGEGYFVHVGLADVFGESLTDQYEAELMASGVSMAFVRIWKHASQNSCSFIRIDEDGTRFEELESFDT